MIFGFEMVFPTDHVLPHQTHVIASKREDDLLTFLTPIVTQSEASLENISISKEKVATTIKESITSSLSQISAKPAKPKELTVYFKKDSAIVDSVQKEKIASLKAKEAKITGCTTPEGREEHNLKLSKQRAEAVASLMSETKTTIEAKGEECCKDIKQKDYEQCRKAQISLKR